MQRFMFSERTRSALYNGAVYNGVLTCCRKSRSMSHQVRFGPHGIVITEARPNTRSCQNYQDIDKLNTLKTHTNERIKRI